MRSHFAGGAILAAMLLSGCASEEVLRDDAIMDQIEHSLVMPAGARSLNNYARYYAPEADGVVEAVYIKPIQMESGPDVGCAEITENFALSPVPCETPKPTDEIRAGQRQWRQGQRDLPNDTDGGCDILHILYSLRQHTFIMARCSGVG